MFATNMSLALPDWPKNNVHNYYVLGIDSLDQRYTPTICI